MPFTMGFIGKFYLFTSGVSAGLYWPTATLVVGSTIGLFYYLRVVAEMGRSTEGEASIPRSGTLAGAAALAVLCAALVILGLYPQALINFISTAG
jgi:NADH-quinone oxidoreductase subunit N